MLAPRIIVAACTCTWRPCRCEEIERLSPETRIEVQDFLARSFLAKRRRADFEIRKQARTTQVGVRRFGLDGRPAAAG